MTAAESHEKFREFLRSADGKAYLRSLEPPHLRISVIFAIACDEFMEVLCYRRRPGERSERTHYWFAPKRDFTAAEQELRQEIEDAYKAKEENGEDDGPARPGSPIPVSQARRGSRAKTRKRARRHA